MSVPFQKQDIPINSTTLFLAMHKSANEINSHNEQPFGWMRAKMRSALLFYREHIQLKEKLCDCAYREKERVLREQMESDRE